MTKRVFAPLGATDFSSLARQLPPPNKVDGYFWVVGGSATVPSLKAFVQAYGKLSPTKIMGNLFFSVTGNFEEIAPQINGAYTGGFGTPGLDYVHGKAQKRYLAITRHWFKEIPPLGKMSVANAYNGFFVNDFSAAWGLVKGLQAVKGNISPSQVPLQKALGKVSLNGPFGKVTLDSNRQAIEGEWSYQIGAKPGKPPTVKTVQYIPNVNQTFSGRFSSSSPPPGRTQPPCKKAKLAWAGKERPVVNGVIK